MIKSWHEPIVWPAVYFVWQWVRHKRGSILSGVVIHHCCEISAESTMEVNEIYFKMNGFVTIYQESLRARLKIFEGDEVAFSIRVPCVFSTTGWFSCFSALLALRGNLHFLLGKRRRYELIPVLLIKSSWSKYLVIDDAIPLPSVLAQFCFESGFSYNNLNPFYFDRTVLLLVDWLLRILKLRNLDTDTTVSVRDNC